MDTLGNLVPTLILIHSTLPTFVGNHFIPVLCLAPLYVNASKYMYLFILPSFP